MKIVLTKLTPDRHLLAIVRADGTREQKELVTREFAFHDVLHFAVEAEIPTQEGFWGSVAAGKSFAQMNERGGMQACSGMLAGVEMAVGMMTGVIKSATPAAQALEELAGFFASSGQTMPAWFDAAFVTRVQERMRKVWGQWNGLRVCGVLEIDWPE